MDMTWEVDRAAVVVDLARGGRLASLVVDGHELLVARNDDVLGWGCYAMAPWAGRVRSDVLPRREGHDHPIHGTVVDRAWERIDDRSWSTDLGDGLPGGRVVASLDLRDDGLDLGLELSAGGALPATIGWHPWFRRRLDDGTVVEVDVAPTAAWEVDDDLLPTGEVVDVPARPWDTPFTGLHRPPRLRWPGAVDLTLDADVRCWVVYTPAHAVCVEPQTHRPDALHLDDVDIVRPGHPLRLDLHLHW